MLRPDATSVSVAAPVRASLLRASQALAIALLALALVPVPGLAAGSRYLGAISHTTPDGLYDATLLNVVTP